jgi:hypothetical protein
MSTEETVTPTPNVYQFYILSLEKRNLENNNTISKVLWKREGVTYDGYFGFVQQSLELPTSGIGTTSFIPYGDVTKNDIINWISGIENISEIDSEIDRQIEELKTSPEIIRPGDFPWED